MKSFGFICNWADKSLLLHISYTLRLCQNNENWIMKRYPKWRMRLFILRRGKGEHSAYNIAYGVFGVTDSNQPLISSQFSELVKCGKVKYYTAAVSVASDRSAIIGIFNDIATGISLRESLRRWGIDDSDLTFDAVYMRGASVAPLHIDSDFGDEVIYASGFVCDNPSVLFNSGDIHPTEGEIDMSMQALAEYLSGKTTIPSDIMYERIGNLEVLNSPGRDEYGKSLVHCVRQKGNSQDQRVVVSSSLAVDCHEVIVNMRMWSDGNMCSDTLQRRSPATATDIEFVFSAPSPLDRLDIKVWLRRDADTSLVYQTTRCFIKSIQMTLGVSSKTLHIDSPWLQSIRRNIKPQERKTVEKAATIDKTSHTQFTIGATPQKSKGGKYVHTEPDKKCDDAFFPVGWDSKTRSHGALAFLEWFRRITENARSLVLLDPYFEDVALYFLACSEVDCEYTVITQTSLRTNSDNTSYTSEGAARKEKLLAMIKSNPQLFRGMNLVIRDMPGSAPKLHDRYIIVEYNDGNSKGYLLSNSLQGATKKQPLVVCGMGQSVLTKVKEYISDTIEDLCPNTIYDCDTQQDDKQKELNEIADPGFYDWLRSSACSDPIGTIDRILADIAEWETERKLSTAGYALSHISNRLSYIIIEELVAKMSGNHDWVARLEHFILVRHYSPYPVGFINCPDISYYMDSPAELITNSFDEIVNIWNVRFISECYFREINYRVWGQYFACKLLIMISPEAALDVLRKLCPTLRGISTDKTIEPVYKVTNVLVSAILRRAIMYKDDRLLRLMLADRDDWCRGIGCLIVLLRCEESDFDLPKWAELLVNSDERIKFCEKAITAGISEKCNAEICDMLVNDMVSKAKAGSVIDNIIRILLETCQPECKLTYLQNVCVPLITMGVITTENLCREIVAGLFEQGVSPDSKFNLKESLGIALGILGGGYNELIAKSTKERVSAEYAIRNIVVKDDNNIFRACRRLLNVEELLMIAESLCRLDSDKSIIKAELYEISAMLDRHGIERYNK